MPAPSAFRLCRFVLSLCTIVVLVPCEARVVDEMGVRLGTKRLSSAAEGDHTCLVRADGNVLCWGNNASGQIGDGTSGNIRNVPTAVPGITSAVAVAAGLDHTCVLLASGSVRCWGSNASGQLGVGSATASSLVPVTVPNLTSVVSLAAGTSHTCARKSDGTVRCWGLNTFGRLGDGTTTSPRFTPVAVSNLSDAVKIVAGATHTCALRGGGSMSCWGGNGQGQLGIGDTGDRSTPQTVVDIAEVTEIAAGLRFTCAVRGGGEDFRSRGGGQVFCWGDNDLGQLGNATPSNNSTRPVPTLLIDSEQRPTPAVDIVAGQTHVCASLMDGGLRLRCWGGNNAGQLGIGSTSAFEATPQSVSGPSLEMSGGRKHSCALLANEAVRCWGDNALGQLGNGGSAPALAPTGVQALIGSISARSLAAGTNHSCAVRSEGAAACWGRNDGGAIGDGTTTDRLVPTRPSLFRPIVAIAGGGNHTCAAIDDLFGTHCWGDNRSRQVDPNREQDFVLTPVATTVGFSPVALSAGSLHGCGVDAFDKASCRGSNANLQLSSFINNATFENNVGFFVNVTAVAAGGAHSCALRSTGRIHCWGSNGFGQLGDGTRTSTNAEREVVGIVNAVSLSSQRDHNCALLATGVVVCWGRNDFGQVDGTLGGDRLVPTPVTTLAAGDAVAVTTGFQHSCILTHAGTVRCWGSNDEGQLGNNTTTDSLAPVTVQNLPQKSGATTLTGVVGLVSDAAHNCALRVTGQPVCWGRNPEGQLGDNTRTRRLGAVGVGSFTANIAPDANLSGKNRIAHVTALVNCPAGERFVAEITVAQGTASGQGRASGACTGGLTGYPLIVPAQGREGFAPGEAVAHAEVTVHSRGEITDEQEWTRRIELLP